MVPDELQILNNLIKIRLAFAGPFMHEFRVKDIPKTSRIDDYPFWLFGCGNFLFAVRNALLDRRGGHDLHQFLSFTITRPADSSGDECVNKQPQE